MLFRLIISRAFGWPKCPNVPCLVYVDRVSLVPFPEILTPGSVRSDGSVAACPNPKLFLAQSRNFPVLNRSNSRLLTTLRDRFQRAVEQGSAQRAVATLVKPSCLIVDEVRRCVFDRASVFMMRGPSYRNRGLATHSVEAVPQATNVRGCSPRGVAIV